MKRELLIGCGSARDKRLTGDGDVRWSNLTTLDSNEHHKPDVVWDLLKLPLPFETDSTRLTASRLGDTVAREAKGGLNFPYVKRGRILSTERLSGDASLPPVHAGARR